VVNTDFHYFCTIFVRFVSRLNRPTLHGHCLHHLLPHKTSAHCPYSLRKRHYYQLPNIEFSQYKKTVLLIDVYLSLDDHSLYVLYDLKNAVCLSIAFLGLCFLSRVSVLTRDIDIADLSVRLSVRPSVRYVPVLYENGLTYSQTFFTVQSFPFYQHQTS